LYPPVRHGDGELAVVEVPAEFISIAGDRDLHGSPVSMCRPRAAPVRAGFPVADALWDLRSQQAGIFGERQA
jgi:hypothetical protein